MTRPTLSIVILNHNTCDLLVSCIESARAHASDFELIVVDNASADDSVQVLKRKFQFVSLIALPKNRGFAHGMNEGIRHASAPLLLALNADTELLPNTLPPLFRALDRFPRGGILGAAQCAPETGEFLPTAFSDPTLMREFWRLLFFRDSVAARLHLGPWKEYRDQLPRRVDWLVGAALLFRRECLDAVKGFDEGQFMYGEDWDICYRARQAGWQVYFVPEAKIIHHQNASAAKEFGSDRLARVFEMNLYFHEKHFGRASRRGLAVLALIGTCLRLALLLPFRVLRPSNSKLSWQAHVKEARAAAHGLW